MFYGIIHTSSQKPNPSPKMALLGHLRRDSYCAQVTVNPYNGPIAGTNPVVRHFSSLTWLTGHVRVQQHKPKHATKYCRTGSTPGAQAPMFSEHHRCLQYGRTFNSEYVTIYWCNGPVVFTNATQVTENDYFGPWHWSLHTKNIQKFWSTALRRFVAAG